MAKPNSCTERGKVTLHVESDVHWRCMKCDFRQPMDTPDGNEEWKFHCDQPMRIQPTWRFAGVSDEH